jgi:hypothetical protein
VVQRRFAQRTVFVWGVSLDGAPLNLRVSELDPAATLVQVIIENQSWYLLANPQRKKLSVGSPVDSLWQTDKAFDVRAF